MGVNNVNNLNKADLVKLALTKKGQSTTVAKPTWMTSTGSIFNVPQSQKSRQSASLQDLNTLRSLNDIKSGNNHTTGIKAKASNAAGKSSGDKMSNDEMANIDNASDGKRAANEVGKQKDNVKNLTSQTEDNTKQMEKFDKDSVKLDKKIAKDEKTFQKKMKSNEDLINKNSKEIAKEAKTMEQQQTEVDSLQSELDSLVADKTGSGKSSAFSLSIGNAVNEGEEGGVEQRGDSERLEALQQQLGAKIELMSGSQKKIYTLQKSSNKTIKTMNKMSKQQIKTQKTNQKDIEANQKTSDKVIKVADKIDQISGLVATAGTTLNYAGKGLIALGSSMSWAAGAGAALIATGKVMSQVGTVTEMVGQYGQAAANITKTAAYAAQGNLAGALTSAASALASGASAAKSTKGLSKNLNAINDQAKGATQKLSENVAKKQAAEQAKSATTKLGIEGKTLDKAKDLGGPASSPIDQAKAGLNTEGMKLENPLNPGTTDPIKNAKAPGAITEGPTLGSAAKVDTNKLAASAKKDMAKLKQTLPKNTNVTESAKLLSMDNLEKLQKSFSSAGAILAQMQKNDNTAEAAPQTNKKPKTGKTNMKKGMDMINKTNNFRNKMNSYYMGKRNIA